MRRTLTLATMIAVSCLILSCGSHEPDTTALRKTIDEYNAASKDALMGGGTEKLVTFLDDNAAQLPPNMSIIKGKDAIRAFWDQSAKAGMKMTSVEFTTLDVQASGTLAYEIGAYDMTLAGNVGGGRDIGKYVTLWSEQSDGTWKVVAETWNSDKPVPVVEKKAETKHKVMSRKSSAKKSAVSKKSAAKKKPVAKKPTSKKSTKKSTKTGK